MADLPTESDPVRVIQADCLDVLRALPDGCVDAVVTDPPYGTGGHRRTAAGQGAKFSGTSQRETWDVWRLEWLTEAFRLSPGVVALFCPERELPGLVGAAGGRDWRMLTWCKPDPMPHQGGHAGYATEAVVAFGALQPAGGRNWIEASTPRANRDAEHAGHPYQKPLRVMRWLVRHCCPPGGLVLDPFAGSGTTGVACAIEGRRCLLIEKEPSYVAIARRRVDEALGRTGLFASLAAGEATGGASGPAPPPGECR